MVAASLVRMPPIAWTARIATAILFAAGIAVVWASGPTEAQARATHARLNRDNLYTTTIPGYRSTGLGVWEPQPGGQGSGRFDAQITMQGILMYGEYFCPPAQQCEREQGDLTYWRESAAHGYALRRGDAGIYLTGGFGVDRALLREAVKSARLMTDEEVIQSLPPAPSWPGVANWIRSVLPEN